MTWRAKVWVVASSLGLGCAAGGATASTAPGSDADAPTAAACECDADGTGYDAAQAERLGADEYGMRQYVMALLRIGPNRDLSDEEAARLQRAHLDNINRLAEEGTLVLAGPFMDGGALRGIYIFDVRTIEEAEALTKTDPAIESGALVMELHPWYGSAAVRDIGRVHERIAKQNP